MDGYGSHDFIHSGLKSCSQPASEAARAVRTVFGRFKPSPLWPLERGDGFRLFSELRIVYKELWRDSSPACGSCSQIATKAIIRFQLGKEGTDVMDLSNMDVSDWIIRTAIFAVMACAVIGTLQNLTDALKGRKSAKGE